MQTSMWLSVPLMFFIWHPCVPQPRGRRHPRCLRSSRRSARPRRRGLWRRPQSEIDKAVAARDYERAERLLADAIARQPSSRQLLTQIAGVFMMDRKPLNAAIALKKAEALGPLDNARAAAACAGLHRDEARRLGASRAGAPRRWPSPPT